MIKKSKQVLPQMSLASSLAMSAIPAKSANAQGAYQKLKQFSLLIAGI